MGKVKKWYLGEFLGGGNFGKVYKAMEVSTGNKFAVKICYLSKKLGKKNRRVIEGELNVLPKLNHKNIVKYLDHEILDDKLYLYLELLDQGSIMALFEYLGDEFDEV